MDANIENKITQMPNKPSVFLRVRMGSLGNSVLIAVCP